MTDSTPAFACGTVHRKTIPVLRPLLPDAKAIMPYIAKIDASRVYSNFGPLVAEFPGQTCAKTIDCASICARNELRHHRVDRHGPGDCVYRRQSPPARPHAFVHFRRHSRGHGSDAAFVLTSRISTQLAGHSILNGCWVVQLLTESRSSSRSGLSAVRSRSLTGWNFRNRQGFRSCSTAPPDLP